MSADFDDGKDEGALRTIGEVSRALGIKTHILRYWEQQFPMLDPLKRSGGRRYYRQEDVGLVRTINHLVNIEGYTLKGAQQAIASGKVQAGEGEGAVGNTGFQAGNGNEETGQVLVDSKESSSRTDGETPAATAPFPPVEADPADPGGLGNFFGRPAAEAEAASIPEIEASAGPAPAAGDQVGEADEAPSAGLSREEVIGHLRQLRARLVEALAA